MNDELSFLEILQSMVVTDDDMSVDRVAVAAMANERCRDTTRPRPPILTPESGWRDIAVWMAWYDPDRDNVDNPFTEDVLAWNVLASMVDECYTPSSVLKAAL